jgi:Tfp pilus assembly PilM family ATPase
VTRRLLASLPLQRLKHRSHRAPALVTALDLDGQTLRVVQAVSRGDRPVITKVAAASLDLPQDADRSDPALIGHAIARALNSLGLKPGSIVMGVPRAQVVLRSLTLPAIDDIRQLAAMVHFQIGRDLPFRLDEAVVDFKVRPPVPPSLAPEPPAPETKSEPASNVPTAKVEVLVAAARREVVEFYQQTADAAGVKLAALGLLAHANVRCVEACLVGEDNRPFALVSLRPDEVSIDVIARQTLLFSRGASLKAALEPAPLPDTPPADGSEPGASSPEAPKPLAFSDAATIEVVRSLNSYSGLDLQTAAAKVVVAGATGHEAEVVEALGKRLAIPCTLLDPATLDLPPDAVPHAAGSTAAIGLALALSSPQGLPFDFLNPKHPAQHRDLRRIRVLAGIAATAAALVFLLAIRSYLLNHRENLRRELAAELAEAEKKSPIYRRMIQQAASVAEWTREGRNWIEHYAYLSSILPASEDLYVTSLTVSGQGNIRLAVQAQSGEILARVEKQLRAAGYEVKPLAITPGADRYGYGFRSTVELIVPDKLKIDLTKLRIPARPADDASLDPTVARKGGSG